MKKHLLNPRNYAFALFWSWNIIFLAFMLLGFVPIVLLELVTAVQSGTIPAAYLAYGGILTLIPVLAVILGFTVLRHEPGKLFALGYGVEGPLMILLGVRFFIVRDMTPAIAFLLLCATLGVLTYLWQILDRFITQRGALLIVLRLVGLTLLLLTGLYAAVWIAFYMLPLGVDFLQNVGDILRDFWRGLATLRWSDIEWRFVPFAVLGFTLLTYTGTLLVLMPIAVTILYVRGWWQGLRDAAARGKMGRAIGLSTAVAILCVLIFIQSNKQPQHTAFALLEAPPTNPAEAQALLAQEETIRKGLLNAYLAPQRYISAVGEVRHIRELYEWAMDVPPAQALAIEHAYEKIASPLLYQPVTPQERTNVRFDDQALRNEPAQAAELYAQFFDQPIIVGEQAQVVQAVRSTWMPDQARAGWQAVDDREVYLAHQEVNIVEQGDWAEVELYELYENQTGQRQEVIYYFSLPETAVVTGLWLGNSADRAERFEYHVAPRGAAQAVYRNEVRRNMDPALLEQIGPRQYRLRIFPIQAQEWEWDEAKEHSILNDAPPLHLWFTYRVLADGQTWPLPKLAKLLNVYWDDNSERLLNGQPLFADGDSWLPESAPASAQITPASHAVSFPNDDLVLARQATAVTQPLIPDDLRLAVVVDRSRSMAAYEEELQEALAQIAAQADPETVDVYLTASPYRGETPSMISLAQLDMAEILFYGGQDSAALLAQFAEMDNGQPYDAILVLTDGTGFELGPPTTTPPIPKAPLWMVHMAGDFPLGYDDATLAAIQASGGGAAASVAEALTRLMVKREALATGIVADLVGGYLWQVIPGATAVTLSARPADRIEHASTDDFAAFAGRQLILAALQTAQGDLQDLALLDQLHALATEQSIVTPYSSMIVLVTSEQERLLQKLTNADDRFEREFEEVGETAGQNALAITGVPEPEEWLLIGLAVLMLGWFVYRERWQQPLLRN